MFDLFRSRAKAMRYLLGALLFMVAFSMVITLIPGWGTSSGQADQVLAEIGGEPVLVREAVATIRAQLKSNNIPVEMYEQYVPIVVNQIIADRAVAYQAARMGFEVSEEDLAESIITMVPSLAPEGKFVGKDLYQQYLSQMGVSIPEFEGTVRKQMLLVRMQNLALDGMLVSAKEVDEEYRRKNEKLKVDYVLIDPIALQNAAVVTDQEIQAHYEKNKTMFQTPEKRAFDLVVVDEAKIAAAMTIPDEELRQAYEAARDRYRLPERVKVRHILLKTTGNPKEEHPKIKARAEGLLKQIRGGADFAELAKKNSEDPGSAPKGGDLDWIIRGQSVKKFEEAAFTLKPKETSGVIETEIGYHILQVMEKENARMRPFAEVKDELAGERKRQRVFERVQSLADQARAELNRKPGEGEAIAARLGVDFARVERAGRGDPLPQVGVNDEFIESVFSQPKGGVTAVQQVAGNKLAVAALREVFPPRPATLDESRPQIREQLKGTAGYRLVEESSTQFAARLKEAGNDLAKAAKSMKLEVKSAPEFGRDGDLTGVGPVAQMLSLFDQPAGFAGGPYRISDKTVFCRIAAKVAADMSKLAGERASLVTSIKQRKSRDRKELFDDGVVTRLIEEGKVKLNDAALKRLVASFRG